MTMRRSAAFVAIILILLLVQSVFAAPQRKANQRGKGKEKEAQAQAPEPIGPKAKSKEEFDSFIAVQNEMTPATRVTLADTFLSTYPESELKGFVLRFQMDAYSRLGKNKEAIAAAEQALAAEEAFVTNAKASHADSPEVEKLVLELNRTKIYYYQNIMSAYQNLNDAQKAIDYAEKALEIAPDDPMTLLTLPRLMGERPPQDEKERDKQMKRAEDLAKKGLAKVNALLAGPMSAQMSDAQKAGIQSDIHQTLGLIYLNLKKYGDSQKEYLLAIQSKNDDPVAYFRLGLAYAQDKKVDQAIDSLAKSVFLKGLTEQQARDILQQIYQAKNKSLDGLDKLIEEAGQKIQK